MAGEDSFLSRWSRRKSEAKDPSRAVPPEPARVPAAAVPAAPQAVPTQPAAPQPLPAIDTLTPESDFTPFMGSEVDGDVRRQALKTLFRDPHFNVMDMMDVYVDDYSKPDPIPESWMGKLEQLSRLGDRAGRDREEAERQKALLEASAASPPMPADTAPDAPPEQAAAPEPTAEAADAADGDVESPLPPRGIPASPVGE